MSLRTTQDQTEKNKDREEMQSFFFLLYQEENNVEPSLGCHWYLMRKGRHCLVPLWRKFSQYVEIYLLMLLSLYDIIKRSKVKRKQYEGKMLKESRNKNFFSKEGFVNTAKVAEFFSRMGKKARKPKPE